MLSDYEFDELPREVKRELLDPKYLHRLHSSHSTYGDGCSGPLCLKAARDRSRVRYAAKRARIGKTVKIRPVARLDFEEEERIEAITEWYLANRGTIILAA